MNERARNHVDVLFHRRNRSGLESSENRAIHRMLDKQSPAKKGVIHLGGKFFFSFPRGVENMCRNSIPKDTISAVMYVTIEFYKRGNSRVQIHFRNTYLPL